MTRRSTALLLTCALAFACGGAAPQQPNVVLIVIETEGEGHAETPNLSRLATDGVFYPNAFGHSPASQPASACR